MAIVPKRKTSKQRKHKRRTHDVLTSPTLVTCGTCSGKSLPHHACSNCGFYNGKKVIEGLQK